MSDQKTQDRFCKINRFNGKNELYHIPQYFFFTNASEAEKEIARPMFSYDYQQIPTAAIMGGENRKDLVRGLLGRTWMALDLGALQGNLKFGIPRSLVNYYSDIRNPSIEEIANGIIETLLLVNDDELEVVYDKAQAIFENNKTAENIEYYFPTEKIEAHVPANYQDVIPTIPGNFGGGLYDRYFIPQQNNLDTVEPFSLIDNVGRLVNKETIVIVDKAPGSHNADWSQFKIGKSLKLFRDMTEFINLDKDAGGAFKRKEDHTFVIQTPFGPSDGLGDRSGFKEYFVDYDSEYNNYNRKYEEALALPYVRESNLPNIYVEGIAETISDNSEILNFENLPAGIIPNLSALTSIRDDIAKFLTLDGQIQPGAIDGLAPENKKNFYSDVMDIGQGQYFNVWGDTAKTPQAVPVLESLQNPYSKISILPGGNFAINEFNNRKAQYPMHNSIMLSCPNTYNSEDTKNFSACPDAKFSNLLDLLDYHDLRCPVFKTALHGSNLPFASLEFYDLFNNNTSTPGGGVAVRPAINFYSGAPSDNISAPFAMRDWLWYFKLGGPGIYEEEDTLLGSLTNSDVAFGHYLTEPDPLNATGQDRFTRVESFEISFRDLLKEKTRTFKQILDGETACTEILGWKITKKAILPDGNDEPNTGQTYVMPYSKDDIVQFIDTQVKYDKDYRYEIVALVVVYGTEYEYYFPEATPTFKSDLDVLDLARIKSAETHPEESYLEQIKSGGMPSQPGALEGQLGSEFQKITAPLKITPEDGVGTNAGLVLDVYSRPSVKIIEVPWFKTPTMRILDKPPTVPNVEFFPYRGANNYLINLEHGSGQETALPIPIFVNQAPPGSSAFDAEQISKQYAKQYLKNAEVIPFTESTYNSETGEWSSAIMLAAGDVSDPANIFDTTGKTLDYASDDPPSSYEIFRLDRAPTSYEDFQNGLYLEIESEGVTSISLRPAEMGRVEPNRNYYYTFRAKDIHGNISNPTIVYEVMVVNDSGAVYLVVNPYEFPQPKKKFSKKLKRFLSVSPTREQTKFTNSIATDENGKLWTYVGQDPKLGREEEPLFDSDKTYKVRLTSKKTGRKLDVNVKFKTKKIKTNEETEAQQYVGTGGLTAQEKFTEGKV